MQTYTSKTLSINQVYTRRDLSELFDITDATINTGVFRPKGTNSIWLFITERKTADRTQYHDKMVGGALTWQGQSRGRTDRFIIDHKSLGLEILVFYRKEKYEFTGAGFLYCGRFEYITHTGSEPATFELRQIDGIQAAVAADLDAYEAEESQAQTFTEGGVAKVLTNRYERDPKLRQRAIEIHGLSCQVCGFNFLKFYGEVGRDYIEVHHLRPVSSYEEPEQVDPKKDMAVVCANCHRMIHRRREHPLTLEELTALLVLTSY